VFAVVGVGVATCVDVVAITLLAGVVVVVDIDVIYSVVVTVVGLSFVVGVVASGLAVGCRCCYC